MTFTDQNSRTSPRFCRRQGSPCPSSRRNHPSPRQLRPWAVHLHKYPIKQTNKQSGAALEKKKRDTPSFRLFASRCIEKQDIYSGTAQTGHLEVMVVGGGLCWREQPTVHALVAARSPHFTGGRAGPSTVPKTYCAEFALKAFKAKPWCHAEKH